MSIFPALMALAGFAGAGGFMNLERQLNADPMDNPSLMEWTIPAGSAAMMGMLPGGVGMGAAEGVRQAFPKVMGGSQLNPSGIMNRMLNWSPLQRMSQQPFVQNQLRPFAQRNVVGRVFPTSPLTSPLQGGQDMNNLRSLRTEGLSRVLPGVGQFAHQYPLSFTGGLAGGLGGLGSLLMPGGQPATQAQEMPQLSPEERMILMQLMQQQQQGYR